MPWPRPPRTGRALYIPTTTLEATLHRKSAFLFGALTLSSGSPSAAVEILFDPASGSAFLSLQHAIDQAAGGDTVLVAPGEYTLSRPLDFNRLHDPLEASSPPRKDIVLRSLAGPEATVLRLGPEVEDPARGSVVLFKSGETGASVLEGFTITGGTGMLLDCAAEECAVGGGILCGKDSSPTLRDLKVIANRSGSRGGAGIHCEPGSAPVMEGCEVSANFGSGIYFREAGGTLTDCVIAGNHAQYGGGGGGITCLASSPSLTRSTIDSNQSADHGGGMHLVDGSAPVLNACTITGNSAGHYTFGMGIYCRASSPRLTDCRLVANSWADYSAGGGLYCEEGSAPVLTRCEVSRNRLTCGSGAGLYCRDSALVARECVLAENWVDNGERGGAIFVVGNSRAVISDSTIRSNTADLGGGIFCDVGATPIFERCKILENHARMSGGGFGASASSPEIIHSTVIGNTARGGGSAFSSAGGAEIRVQSSIVWENPGAVIDLQENSVVAATYSLVEGGWPGQGNVPGPPLFCAWGAALEVYVDASRGEGPGDGSAGDPFATVAMALDYRFALALGSPCIDAGADGTDMGAPAGRCDDPPSGPSRTVRLARGTYRMEGSSLFHHASLLGAGAGETIIEGTVMGLRTGAVLSDLTVTGGRYSGVRISPGEAPSILRSAIEKNTGGGIHCDGGSPTVADSVIVENTYGLGEYDAAGGLFCSHGSSPTIVRTTIARNRTYYGGGSGITLVKSTGSFTDCRILENGGSDHGGTGNTHGSGVNATESTASFAGCVFAGNISETGGAVYLANSAETFTNCLFAGNQAARSAAIHVESGPATPVFTSSTIAANAITFTTPSQEGAVIYCGAPLWLINCVVWGHRAASLLVGRSEAEPMVTYSCIEGSAPWPGRGNIAADPLFVNSTWDSGAGDFHLEAGSPAIDAGDPESSPREDLDGNPRPCGGEVDMGAYERCEGGEPPAFRRGDADGAPGLNISDSIAVLRFLFLGSAAPACDDAADADDSGKVEITDPIAVLDHLFLGRAILPAPGPSFCGPDPTPDGLGCEESLGCP